MSIIRNPLILSQKMKDKIVRVALKRDKLTDWMRFLSLEKEIHTIDPSVRPFEPEEVASVNKSEATPAPITNPADLSLGFSFESKNIPGFSIGRTGYHSGSVNFSFPEKDAPRVGAWFSGRYDAVRNPASDTLLRNLSDAVKELLLAYFHAAAAANLFTAPFRMGWAFRFNNGSRKMIQQASLFSPYNESPLLPVTSSSVAESSAISTADIINSPKSLSLQVNCTIPADFDWGDITHIDIIATPQPDLVPSPLSATGTSSVVLDNKRYMGYAYNRVNSSSAEGTANMQNDFRIIASVPVSRLSAEKVIPLEIPAGGLANWKQLPKYSSSGNSGSPDDPDTPDSPDTPDEPVWEPYIDKITDPLDLGNPEARKWVRAVALRGCFSRTNAVSIRLYGSQHRQNWRLIARGSNGWASALMASGYRWFRVRITGNLARHDFIDAVSFRISRIRAPR